MRQVTPADERGRYEAAVRLLGMSTHLLSEVVKGPAGRLLRRAVDRRGNYLFAPVDIASRTEFIPLVLVDLIRAVRALKPSKDCEGCNTGGCKACLFSGYVPESIYPLADGPPLDSPQDAVEVLWWVRKNGVGVQPAADEWDEEGDENVGLGLFDPKLMEE
jgi:hypothetical protein